MMVINFYTQKHVIEYFDTNVIHRAFSQRVLWDNVIATDKSLLWREGGIKKFGEGIHNSITRGRPASQRPRPECQMARKKKRKGKGGHSPFYPSFFAHLTTTTNLGGTPKCSMQCGSSLAYLFPLYVTQTKWTNIQIRPIVRNAESARLG